MRQEQGLVAVCERGYVDQTIRTFIHDRMTVKHTISGDDPAHRSAVVGVQLTPPPNIVMALPLHRMEAGKLFRSCVPDHYGLAVVHPRQKSFGKRISHGIGFE